MATSAKATINDLYRVRDKAEIVDGEIVVMSPTGGLPGMAGGHRLRKSSRVPALGRWRVRLPRRRGVRGRLAEPKILQSRRGLPPGPRPTMKFVEGAPVFAVEVRSEEDYGPAAEQERARKRAHYFAARTLVVWDVDLQGSETIRSYQAGGATPRVFRRSDLADAEPALPGWRFRIDELFE